MGNWYKCNTSIHLSHPSCNPVTDPTTNYDNPWKQALSLYFPNFIAFFFPQIYAEIDWTKPYEFLDKELQ